MFRSRISLSFLAVAAVACLAAASAIVHRTVEVLKVAAIHVVDVLAAPDKMDRTAMVVPQRLLQAAQAFYLRLVKRERPLIHSNFRMCPSA